MRCLLVFLVACGGSNGGMPSSDAGEVDGASPDSRLQDPDDPVEEVGAHSGAYTFGKLTTNDQFQFSGTFFNDDSTEHEVSATPMSYARYRDATVLQSKFTADAFLYDQEAATIGPAIQLPSDAIGQIAIRGGMLYIGGTAKIYSYEIATQMWRSQAMPSTGACHHVAAGLTRLFAICAHPGASGDDLFSMWANKSMSDVVPIGTVTPGEGAELGWLAVGPGSDTAYFNSESPNRSCIGRMTLDAHEPCALDPAALATITKPLPTKGLVSEDGATLYVTLLLQSDNDRHLFEIDLATSSVHSIRSVESFATCPDNAVVFQDGTISQRRAGGVTTDVRLGDGGQNDMACPLQKL